jgi:hypothetical protein
MGRLARLSFNFGIAGDDAAGLISMQQVASNDTAFRSYAWQSIMSENIMRQTRQASQASVTAQAVADSASGTKTQSEKDEKSSSRAYSITYFNPVLQTTEVLEARSEIRIKDVTTRTIEESVAAGSLFPLYQYIGTPLIRKEVLPWKLEEILSQREYGTPPPPPTGAAVTPVRIIAQKEEEIAALKKREEEIKEAVEASIVRKEKSELRIAQEILLMEETISSLRLGDPIDRILARLPPLSRARYILLLRKKRMGREAIISMLLKDIGFLKMVKKKLELFTLDDLKGMYKILRDLQKR